MAKHQINFADENLISKVVEPEGLVERVPRLKGFFEGVKDMREVLASEPGGRSPFTGSTGWWKGSRMMQYLGTTPTAVRAAIREIDPGFWEDPVKVVRFYEMHPEYKVKSIVK